MTVSESVGQVAYPTQKDNRKRPQIAEIPHYVRKSRSRKQVLSSEMSLEVHIGLGYSRFCAWAVALNAMVSVREECRMQ